jgi:cell fate regulator YaaT (PSP1 superfamily)
LIMSDEVVQDNIETPNFKAYGNKCCKGGQKGRCYKLDSYDWLKDISEITDFPDIVEVRFKNTRKGYFHNSSGIRLEESDIIAVEASPGHDIGIVSITGQLVLEKLRSEGIDYKHHEFKKIYRKAKPADIEKWNEAIELENKTMFRARKIAEDLKLEMKIGDVEYQGDRTKAIFYYIADDRVDFRELIKVLADEFRVRIEMRQIGARQEAGRIGGIGSCGRELCCSSFITNFVSVTTNAARYQEVSLNPQKLAGQCSKLKCCLNYELDAYLDAQEDFPDISKPLISKEGKAFHQKTDVFKRLMWYSIATEKGQSITCLSVKQVNELIELNEKGEIPEKIKGIEELSMASVIEYQNSAGIESLTRFEDAPSQARNHQNKNNKKKKFRPRGRNFR